MKSSILIVLAAGFVGFGALEVAALNPGEAGLNTPSETADPDTAISPSPIDFDLDTKPSSQDGAQDNAQSAACLTPALVAAFEPRHQALQDRAGTLDRREAELKELEATLENRLTDIKKTRDAIATMTAKLDVVAGDDISHLVDMYSTMKPKNAAAIFDRMDPAFAAGFLREIDPARAGVIMAEMGEEQSYRVSLLIANRHAEWRNGRSSN